MRQVIRKFSLLASRKEDNILQKLRDPSQAMREKTLMGNNIKTLDRILKGSGELSICVTSHDLELKSRKFVTLWKFNLCQNIDWNINRIFRGCTQLIQEISRILSRVSHYSIFSKSHFHIVSHRLSSYSTLRCLVIDSDKKQP